MAVLDEESVAGELATVPSWERRGGEITRTFERASFGDAMSFVGVVAELAEAADHHPDILISYRTVTLTLTSHDSGGLTTRDFALARRVDEAVAGQR